MKRDAKIDVPTALTRAERVVGTLELLAWREILTLRSDALEVIRIILETIYPERSTIKPAESVIRYN